MGDMGENDPRRGGRWPLVGALGSCSNDLQACVDFSSSNQALSPGCHRGITQGRGSRVVPTSPTFFRLRSIPTAWAWLFLAKLDMVCRHERSKTYRQRSRNSRLISRGTLPNFDGARLLTQ